tara:strand:+ start:98198 stop:98722 length:525 start_codon:yes stop_codon:yes gene_type:complete
MNTENIIEVLESSHHDLFEWLNNHPKEKWVSGPKGKWSTGQHILHLVESSKLLNKALSYPKFLIKYKYGTSNRPSRSYEEVAKRYEQRLSENLERAKKFNRSLNETTIKERPRVIDSLQILNKKLQYKTIKLKDKHLDTLLLPHPLMGKMTLREIIMWTAHHTEHHLNILKKNY